VASEMKNHHLYGSSLDINQYSTRTALEEFLPLWNEIVFNSNLFIGESIKSHKIKLTKNLFL